MKHLVAPLLFGFAGLIMVIGSVAMANSKARTDYTNYGSSSSTSSSNEGYGALALGIAGGCCFIAAAISLQKKSS